MTMEFRHEFRDILGKVVSTISYTTFNDDDDNIEEVIEDFRSFLLAVSFSPELIDKYLMRKEPYDGN